MWFFIRSHCFCFCFENCNYSAKSTGYHKDYFQASSRNDIFELQKGKWKWLFSVEFSNASFNIDKSDLPQEHIYFFCCNWGAFPLIAQQLMFGNAGSKTQQPLLPPAPPHGLSSQKCSSTFCCLCALPAISAYVMPAGGWIWQDSFFCKHWDIDSVVLIKHLTIVVSVFCW